MTTPGPWAANRAYGKWLTAKKASDFSLFRDSLAEVVDFTRKAIDLRDEKPATYYNACLDDTEKGGSEAQMDAFFGALKERIVPLMRRIQAEGKPIREDFLTRPCPIPEQERFSHYLLEAEGLRKSALVLMTTEHPFTTEFGPHDVRVTTHYFETTSSPTSSPPSTRAATPSSCRTSRRSSGGSTPPAA